MIELELVREAARRIRDRAAAATPSPWIAAEEIDGIRAGRPTTIRAGRRRVVSVGQTRPHHEPAEANVAHIASWHPAVAVSVADLLDRLADCEEAGYTGDPREREYWEPGPSAWAEAVSLAQMYLEGES